MVYQYMTPLVTQTNKKKVKLSLKWTGRWGISSMDTTHGSTHQYWNGEGYCGALWVISSISTPPHIDVAPATITLETEQQHTVLNHRCYLCRITQKNFDSRKHRSPLLWLVRDWQHIPLGRRVARPKGVQGSWGFILWLYGSKRNTGDIFLYMSPSPSYDENRQKTKQTRMSLNAIKENLQVLTVYSVIRMTCHRTLKGHAIVTNQFSLLSQ